MKMSVSLFKRELNSDSIMSIDETAVTKCEGTLTDFHGPVDDVLS